MALIKFYAPVVLDNSSSRLHLFAVSVIYLWCYNCDLSHVHRGSKSKSQEHSVSAAQHVYLRNTAERAGRRPSC